MFSTCLCSAYKFFALQKTLGLKFEFRTQIVLLRTIVWYTGFVYWQIPYDQSNWFLKFGISVCHHLSNVFVEFGTLLWLLEELRKAKQCEAQRGTVKPSGVYFPQSCVITLLQGNVIYYPLTLRACAYQNFFYQCLSTFAFSSFLREGKTIPIWHFWWVAL